LDENIGPSSRGGDEPERAFLAGVRWGDTSLQEAEEGLSELGSLAETAGATVVGSLMQSRSRPDAATLLGKGKLEELSGMVESSEADLVVFDRDLTPSQQRNLENSLQLKVLDRTALILDIFALHAHSKEGKAQVEMAQLRYGLTHLTGRGVELSRLGGGIGTRGPGETKLEVDRRRINTRIRTLDRELKDLSRQRRIKRKRRDRVSIPTFSLVGYTNAGKSSLLNALTEANVVVEDQLFSTLDPITRRVQLPGNRNAVITDTVGFINHIPHQLIEAFKSTLEEVAEAHVILQIIDASSSDVQGRMRAVNEVLDELEASHIPTIYVLNKADLLEEEERYELSKMFARGVFTSAVSGEGLEELREAMSASLETTCPAKLLVPRDRGDIVSQIYRQGQVFSIDSDEEGYHMEVDIPRSLYQRLGDFMPQAASETDGSEDYDDEME
jgi:GTP-binding protein HflX